MTIPALTLQEVQCLRIGLELLRHLKQKDVSDNNFKNPINEFDLMDSRYTLMHTLTALSKLTQKPISNFQNPNPSQSPKTD